MNILRISLLSKFVIVLLSLVILSCVKAPEQDSAAEVEALSQAWIERVSSAGPGIEGFYSNNAHLIDRNYEAHVGRTEIRDFYGNRYPHESIDPETHIILGIVEESELFLYEIGQFGFRDSSRTMVYGTIWKKMLNGSYQKQFEVLAERNIEVSNLENWYSIVREAGDRFEAAYNSFNIAPELFTDQALYYWGADTIVRGPENILAEMAQGGSEKLSTDLISVVRDDLIFEIGDADGLKYFIIWKNIQGQWKVHLNAYAE